MNAINSNFSVSKILIPIGRDMMLRLKSLKNFKLTWTIKAKTKNKGAMLTVIWQALAIQSFYMLNCYQHIGKQFRKYFLKLFSRKLIEHVSLRNGTRNF